MKRRKIVFLLFLISFVMSLLVVFGTEGVVVSSTVQKLVEVGVWTIFFFVILLILYFILRKTFSQANKLKSNINKKDLNQ
ncbi:hypothetical protein [uncultured Flavobacterium sp.]|uniref:hypothetical protein n=1 Tax=uncultured Flavobacterium sp. TaxID=165435 RepID=UPI0025DF84C4|nr:hypothetical protein [uncultured Flavobacterium sp.]